jgi:hypothetical protein
LQAPDQGITVDFFLFSRLKSIMQGARFADMVAIQERVTAVLRWKLNRNAGTTGR